MENAKTLRKLWIFLHTPTLFTKMLFLKHASTIIFLWTNNILVFLSSSPFTGGKTWAQQIGLLPNEWIHSSVYRTLHWHRRDQGFDSRSIRLNFQVSTRDNCLNCPGKYENYFSLLVRNRRFSRDVIAAMLVDETKRSLISFFCSSTRSRTFHYCYLMSLEVGWKRRIILVLWRCRSHSSRFA